MIEPYAGPGQPLLTDHKYLESWEVSQGTPVTSSGKDQTGSKDASKTKHSVLIGTGLAVVVVLLVVGHMYDTSTSVHHQAARILDHFTTMGPDSEAVHAVMIDAGSTGTRILVFTFQKLSNDGSLLLLEEFFKEIKPGISSFVNTPEKAAHSIQGLVDDAKRIVPSDKWPLTPISLKATAGLRLLPEKKADLLLQKVREVFNSSGFLVRPESVSIIDGTSEGLYLWTTINFLLGKTSDLNETVVVADMGGGSAQLAMIPLDPSTFKKVPSEDITPISFLGRPTKFYIHSYLGLGLMAMRLAILGSTNATTDVSSNNYNCPYIPDKANFMWEFQGKQYNLKGFLKCEQDKTIVKSDAYQSLRQVVSKLLGERGVFRVDELRRRTLFAVSYFYDRAVDADLIVGTKGGSALVQEYCRCAVKACTIPNITQPFSCIDNTYLCALFEEGFGLQEHHVINLQKKINGHETSWALGAALLDLQKNVIRDDD